MEKISYYNRHINEGFDIKGRRLIFTDAHQKVLDTSFDGQLTISVIPVDNIGDVKVYSIFKRCQQTDFKSDFNPVLYALKKERDWDFADDANKTLFWNRFTQLLRRFLRDHKNEFDTTIVVPSSNRLNRDIASEIRKISEKVGIHHISSGGLYTINADDILDAAWEKDSYFREYWGDEFESAYDKLEKFALKMECENNNLFKYHIITDIKLRESILHTLDVDDDVAYMYSSNINGKNIIIVDDSIMKGQTIRNAIYAIQNSYAPASVSVLTMFSRLYDKDGNEL